MSSAKSLASRSVLAVKSSGERFTITLAIGFPYEVTPEQWACSVALHGLHSQIGDVHGIDAWQVIRLAYGFIAQLLGYFVEEGGRLYWPETEEPLEFSELFS